MSESPATPLVSVIVLTWDRRDLLSETLGSVLAQTLGDLEVVVVDNESQDGTAEYVASHADPRVRYIRNANGGSLSVNRNVGIRRSRGRWVAFCDDDDLWYPDKLERQIDVAAKRPEAGIICADVMLFDEAGEIGRYVGERPGTDIAFEDLAGGHNPVMLSSVMVARDAFDKLGMWDESLGVRTVEDWQMWLAAAAAGVPIAYVDAPLVRYRIHAGMASHRDSRDTVDAQRRALERLLERGALTAQQGERVAAGLRRKRRGAGVRETLKRVPGLKTLVYDGRRRKATARRNVGGS